MSNHTKHACFIHSTNMNIWRDEVLLTILDKIISSNLISVLEFVLVNNIGDPLDIPKIQNLHPKIIVVNYSKDLTLFENCTIRTLHQFSKLNPNYNILYMHTKGVSHGKNSIYIDNVFSWNAFMMHILVDNYMKCISLLNAYDTVSCNIRPKTIYQSNPIHFSGNFWWSTTNYIASVPVDYLKDKYDAEFWLLQKNPNWYCIYNLQSLYEVLYPIETYKEFIHNNLQEEILYCKFGSSGIGLCNQLYSLVNSMIIGKAFPGHSTIIVNDFMTDLNSNAFCDPRDIIDFNKMNNFLKPYNISLISKQEVQFSIQKVLFGMYPDKVVDITSKVTERFYKNNKLYIPRGTSLNDITTDPAPGIRKQIYIWYTVNNRNYFKCRHEHELMYNEDTLLDFNQFSNVNWLTKTSIHDFRKEVDTFNLFLQNICFQEKYYTMSHNMVSAILSNHTPDIKINVIHLRVEEDAIDFWAYINRIDKELYRNVLEQKYIRLIQEHIDRDSLTFLLSMNTDNAVTNYMQKNGYQFSYLNKTVVQGREVNAILDYIASSLCTGVFIGNINPNNCAGSTFSYSIYNKLRHTNVKKICIDTDKIFDKEYIV